MTDLSQRRACRFKGFSLSTCRYEAQRPSADAHLSERINELALERGRFWLSVHLAAAASGGPSRQSQAGIQNDTQSRCPGSVATHHR